MLSYISLKVYTNFGTLLVEDEIVISPIYKMVKEYPEDTERDIYQRVTCSHHLNP